MEQLTLKQANEMTLRQINAWFRQHDESHLWPICGRFNATERAIRYIRKMRRIGLEINCGAEYVMALENEISKIVNNQ